MSDGSLSQDEIDALLSGIDPVGGQGPHAGSALGEGEKKAFLAIIEETLETQGQNFLTITGQQTSFGRPVIDVVNRDGFIQGLPEEVLAINVDMVGGVPGEHLFVLGKDLAIRLASLANKEEDLSDLDDMAISAVQEAISTLTGSEVTTISEKTGNKSIQASPANGAFVPKAMVKVPDSEFVRLTYQVQIGSDKAEKLIEIFSLGFVRDIVLASGGGKHDSGFEQAAATQGGGQLAYGGQQGGQMGGQMQGMQGQMGNYGMGGQMQGGQMQGQMGNYGMGGQMQGMQGGGQMGGYGMAPMGYQGYPQGSGMNPPNVQSVQFPNLQVQGMGQESGNIGLIMDVYMEMTVELGRTRKLIKEILGMGEGTIIELDKLAGEPVDILVNHKLIAKGEVVVIDENFGVRVTEIVSPMERMSDMG